jgi:hypothetical protein
MQGHSDAQQWVANTLNKKINKGALFMPRTVGGWTQQCSGKLDLDRTTHGFIDLRGRTTQNFVRLFGRAGSNYGQQFKQTAYGEVSLNCGRQVSSDVKQCGRTVAGYVREFARVSPNTIQCGRVTSNCRKLVRGDITYKVGRTIGGFRKISLSRQVSGNITQEVERAQPGDVKQFGRVVPSSGREFGRVSPNSIQCGRVVAGYIQF